MNKTETLKYLRAAKKEHIKWRSYAQAIHMGLPLDDKTTTPTISTECGFGSWYYGQGQEMQHLDSFRNIESPHEGIHSIYMKMYQVKNREIKVGLFGSKDKAEKERAQELEILMQQMLAVSKDLLEKIAILEEEICHLDENCEIEEYKKKVVTTVESKEIGDSKKPIKKETVKVNVSSLSSDLSDLLNS